MTTHRKKAHPVQIQGRDSARRHIEEAKALTIELGGADQDLKSWFFSLSQRQLRPILTEYGASFGSRAREYAERTLLKWKSGRVQMSGLVAERLFKILPAYMPIEKKFALVTKLWKSQCPKKTRTLYIGPDAQVAEITRKVQANLQELVQNYKVSSTIRGRFEWLAQRDTKLQEELENHFMQQRRSILAHACQNRIPALIAQIRQGGVHRGINQTIIVGNYELALRFHPKATGISQSAPRVIKKSNTSDSNGGCLAIVLCFIAVIVIAVIF